MSDRRNLPPGTFPVNPPGRPALTYRVRTFEMFTRKMAERLALTLENGSAATAQAGGTNGLPPPVRINLGGPDHWLSALVKSWATVADVLTFYQERILQEGFLRTAVEDHSVHELVQMISYRPRPAVAGSGEVALMISDVKGLPQALDLPAGLVIRSVPPPGAEPQVFETLYPLRARASWNRLVPVPVMWSQPPALLGSSLGANLQGTTTGLAPGSGLLILSGSESFFRLLTKVTIQPGAPAFTEVEWASELDAANPQRELAEAEILGLRQQAGLFGQNAPSWRDLPPEIRLQAQPLPGGVVLAGSAGGRSANQGLPVTTAVRCLAVDLDGRIYAGTSTEGVFRSSDRGATWKPARRGLAQPGVETLAVTADGSLFAGTPSGGVYRSTDAGEIWEPANGSALAGSVRRRWPLRRGPVAGVLPATTVRALAAAAWNDRTVLFAGTDNGVFRSKDAGRSWLPVNNGMPGTDAATGVTDLVVQSLAAGPADGLLYAGTVRGVFRSSNGGRRWRAANRGIPASDPFTGLSTTVVHALVSYRDRRQRAHHLLAGTSEGLLLSSDGGASWQAPQRGPGTGGRGPVEVLSLAVADDPVTRVIRVYAGTPEGLWSSLDHGESWTPVPLDGPPRVEALAAGSGGEPVLAATPFGDFGPEWPDFRIRGRQIDLDGVVPGIVSGSWLVLRPGNAAASPGVGIYRVQRVSTVQRRDFGLSATLTRLEVENPDARLAAYDLRQTRVYLQSEPLALHTQAYAVAPASIGLLRNELLAFGDQPRRVITVGQTPPAAFSEKILVKGENLMEGVLESLQDRIASLDPTQVVIVRVWPAGKEDQLPLLETSLSARDLQEVTGEPGSGAWSREDVARSRVATTLLPLLGAASTVPADGMVVSLFLAPQTEGASLWAADLAESLLEPVEVKGQPGADGAPLHTVTLQAAGNRSLTLDASTLEVYCNVVAVAEGVSVRSEMVGDGDAARANQSFQLAQPPAFLRDEPPQSTVEVTVQDQRWTEVPVLHTESGDSRVYRMQLDHEGRATLIFGDGETGARLPSGEGNVKATYRTGMTTRSVPPEGLSLLVTRPLGLDAVTNPLPTSPGAPPESQDEIRVRAPLKVRTLDRVVSLRDYEDYARLFPGVEKAGAWPLTANGSPVVQITLAAASGAQPDTGLLSDLRTAIDQRRAHLAPLDVQGYRAVRVSFRAVVLGDGQAFHRWQELYQPEAAQAYPAEDWKTSLGRRINKALEDELGFTSSRFEGTVSAAAVTSVIQRVPGVVAVDLTAWNGREEETEAEPWEQRALPPRIEESGAIQAAELILLDLPQPDRWDIREATPS